MKKWVMILILCAMLTGCGNSDKEAMTVTTEVIHETVTTTTAASVSETTELTTTEISAENTDATAGKTSTSKTTKRSVTTERENGTTTRSVTESTVSSQTEPERIIDTEMPKTTAESRQTTAAKPAVTTTAKSTTTTITTTTATAKPKQSVSEKLKPKESTTTTTTKKTEKPVDDSTEEKRSAIERWLKIFKDANEKEYYVSIGKSLNHDGTDIGKARAVYGYMQNNFKGQRNCVYMSTVTYALIQGIGLECGYALWSDWYNHCANPVQINGKWYILDTQARGFLCSGEDFTKVFDEYNESLEIKLSDVDYE